MLKLKKVSKSFGDIQALEDISFDVDGGEFVFLTGPSGAGKTTILRLLLKELTPDGGEIIFDGESLANLKRKEIPYLRQQIGVVFQDFKVLKERTVRENVEVALAVLGIPQVEWNKRVDQVLIMVGLDKRSELFPSQLSGGELQRVSLARALVVNPKLVLADEPTGNLDWDTSGLIIDLFDKINKEGKTVIVATHHKLLVDKHKKRVIEIKDGKLVKDSGSTKREKTKKKSKENLGEKKDKEKDIEENKKSLEKVKDKKDSKVNK